MTYFHSLYTCTDKIRDDRIALIVISMDLLYMYEMSVARADIVILTASEHVSSQLKGHCIEFGVV